MVTKARPKKALPKGKRIKKAVKLKPKKKEPALARLMFDSIVDTLEHNALGDGEFNLPSILTRNLDRSHPDYKLGLHRKYYVPAGNVPFYLKGDPQLRTVLQNQAGIVLHGFGEGIPVSKTEIDPVLCKECE